MKKNLFILASAFFALIVLFACSRTVESETNAWDANVKQINALMNEYPGYKTALQTELDNATSLMEDAKKISKDEDKIKAMAKANAVFSEGLSGNLRKSKDIIQDLRKRTVELKGLKMSEEDRASVDRAVRDADQYIYRGEEALRGSQTDLSAAQGVMKRTYEDLKLSKDNVDQLFRNIESKNKKDDKKDTSADTGGENKKDDAPKVVKCGYCSVENEAGSKACSGCGANM